VSVAEHQFLKTQSVGPHNYPGIINSQLTLCFRCRRRSVEDAIEDDVAFSTCHPEDERSLKCTMNSNGSLSGEGQKNSFAAVLPSKSSPNKALYKGTPLDKLDKTCRGTRFFSRRLDVPERKPVKFCDIAGNLQSAFDESSSHTVEDLLDLSEIDLDDSMRHPSITAGVRTEQWGNRSKPIQAFFERQDHGPTNSEEYTLIEGSVGHGRMQAALATGSYFQENSVTDIAESCFDDCGLEEHAQMHMSFDERINRVFDPALSTTASFPARGDPWLSYQRHSEPANLGRTYRKGEMSEYHKRCGRKGGVASPPCPKPKRLKRNLQSEDKGFVDAPGKDDVLMGRGPLVYQHEGNRKFHDEKKKLQKAYLGAANAEKKTLSQQLVQVIQQKGGSFLKFDESAMKWYTVDNETARAKAAQALREDYTKEDRKNKRERYKKANKALSASSLASSD